MKSGDRQWFVVDHGQLHAVKSGLDLDSALQEIHKAAHTDPRLVTIISPNRARLLIGLGAARAVVQFSRGDDPPYMVTVGPSEEEGTTTFSLDGEKTEIPRRNLVAIEEALHAARVFFETDSRPGDLRWEEV